MVPQGFFTHHMVDVVLGVSLQFIQSYPRIFHSSSWLEIVLDTSGSTTGTNLRNFSGTSCADMPSLGVGQPTTLVAQICPGQTAGKRERRQRVKHGLWVFLIHTCFKPKKKHTNTCAPSTSSGDPSCDMFHCFSIFPYVFFWPSLQLNM